MGLCVPRSAGKLGLLPGWGGLCRTAGKEVAGIGIGMSIGIGIGIGISISCQPPAIGFPGPGTWKAGGHRRPGKVGVQHPVLPRHEEVLGAGKKPAANTAEMSLPLSQPAGELPFPKAFLFLAAPP